MCIASMRAARVRILDFCHAASALAQLAQAAFGEGTVEAATWYEHQRHALRHDESLDAPDAVLATAAAVRDALHARGAPAAVLEVASTAVAYLEKRRDQLRYALFARLGYPLGSGIVVLRESANKLVVEARMKGAGMHWARANVNPMLALRGVACSDRWEEAWPQLTHHLRATRREHATQRRATRARRQHCVPPAPPVAPTPPPVAPTPPPVAPTPPPTPPSSASAPANPASTTHEAATVVASPATHSRVPGKDHPWRTLPAGFGRATRVRFYRGRLTANK